MTDEEMANEIRSAADRLCDALNRAGGAGLSLSIAFKPHSSTFLGERTLKTGGWRPQIVVCRKTYLD